MNKKPKFKLNSVSNVELKKPQRIIHSTVLGQRDIKNPGVADDINYQTLGRNLKEAEEINVMHSELQVVGWNMLSRMIAIGERLEKIKARVGHGNWETWIKDNLHFTSRTAVRYITAYKRRDDPVLKNDQEMFMCQLYGNGPATEPVQPNPTEEPKSDVNVGFDTPVKSDVKPLDTPGEPEVKKVIPFEESPIIKLVGGFISQMNKYFDQDPADLSVKQDVLNKLDDWLFDKKAGLTLQPRKEG
jgi:hypothetical protein